MKPHRGLVSDSQYEGNRNLLRLKAFMLARNLLRVVSTYRLLMVATYADFDLIQDIGKAFELLNQKD